MDTIFKNHTVNTIELDTSLANSINQIKKTAAENTVAIGKPKQTDEPWRRTDIKNFNLEQYVPNDEGLNIEIEMDEQAFEILSISEAIQKYPDQVSKIFGQIITKEDGFFGEFALATTENTLFVYLPKNKTADSTPHIQINLSQENTLGSAHILVYVDDNASGELYISYTSSENKNIAYTGVTEVFIGKDSKFTLIEKQEFGKQTWNMMTEKAIVNQNSNLKWIHGGFGSLLTKNFSTVELHDKGSEARLYGAVFVNKDQLLDYDTQQNHLAPHTFSDLDFKIAAKENGRSVWQGMIYVDPIAQQTDAYQNNQNLILSEDAHIDAIPGLEIQANDVSCSHGSSMLNLLEREIFYLLSRGIDKETAEKTLIEGYFHAVTDHIDNEEIKEEFALSIENKLQ